MSSRNRMIVGVVVVILLAGGLYWFFGRSKGEAPAEQPPVAVEQPEAEPTPSAEEELSERLKGTTLKDSDGVVREIVSGLSSRPELVTWLANEDLIRRFVASVHMIAEGKSPRSQVGFLKPKGRFEVDEHGETWVIDPRSYRRYDVVAEAFSALDTEGMVRAFEELEPLIDEANREIAPPGTSFRAVLKRAIDRLLSVPVERGDVEVKPKIFTYTYVDENLEKRSEVERQLLRMGPDNVERIQTKLREFEAALGL